MGELVHIGSPTGELLVPQTTLPDLLCHTITDGELDLLTNTTATLMGGLCTTALGVAAASIVGAWPAIGALKAANPSAADAAAYVYLVVMAVSVTVFILTSFLSVQHQCMKGKRVGIIRRRPKVPMILSEGERA